MNIGMYIGVQSVLPAKQQACSRRVMGMHVHTGQAQRAELLSWGRVEGCPPWPPEGRRIEQQLIELDAHHCRLGSRRVCRRAACVRMHACMH